MRTDALSERCGRLGMPVNIHVADPIWMYEPMDAMNDGLMNAYHWRLDNQPNIVGHSGMIDIFERTVEEHPERHSLPATSPISILLYGTDMGFDEAMYRVNFRVLETLDEHFYETDMFSYHWSLNGFRLREEILQKLYHANAHKILTSWEVRAHVNA
jgi:hypothetical protein